MLSSLAIKKTNCNNLPICVLYNN